MPGEIKASCDKMVKSLGGLMDKMHGLDNACVLMGPCSMSALSTITERNPLIQSLRTVLDRLTAVEGGEARLGDATSCDKCKVRFLFVKWRDVSFLLLEFVQMTVLEIRMVINSATVQQSIINASHAVCDYLAPYEQQCRWAAAYFCVAEKRHNSSSSRDAIDKYAPVAFQLFDKYFQPDAVCQSLGICVASAGEVVVAQRPDGHRWKTNEGWSVSRLRKLVWFAR